MFGKGRRGMKVICIKQVDDQFLLVGSIEGVTVEIPISNRLIDFLRLIGVPDCVEESA